MENEKDEQQVFRIVEMLKQKITKGRQFTPQEKEEFDRLVSHMAQKNILVGWDNSITTKN